MPAVNNVILALDVGEKRIGVASARSDTKLASPLTTLTHDEHVWDNISKLIKEQSAQTVVVGLPRNLEGESTAQTRSVEAFTDQLRGKIAATVHLQDEAVTSVLAEDELEKRGKPYTKADIDSLAATYILEDFLHSPEASRV